MARNAPSNVSETCGIRIKGGFTPALLQRLGARAAQEGDPPRQPHFLTDAGWKALCGKALVRVVHPVQREALEWLLKQAVVDLPLEVFDPLPADADLESLCAVDGKRTWESERFEAIARWLTGRGLLADVYDECGDVLWAEAVEYTSLEPCGVAGFGPLLDALGQYASFDDAPICGEDGDSVFHPERNLCSFSWEGALGLGFYEYQGVKHEPFTDRSAAVTSFTHDCGSAGLIWQVVQGNIVDDDDAIRDLGLWWIGPAMDSAPDDGPSDGPIFGFGDFFTEDEIEEIASGFAGYCGVPDGTESLQWCAGRFGVPEQEEWDGPADVGDEFGDWDAWEARMQGYVDRAFKIWLWGGNGLRPSERGT